jgi:hypothetical protein
LIGRGDGTEILSVPAAGGIPRPVVKSSRSNHEVRIQWPWFLPDGKRFLYTARLDDGDGELRLGRLGDPGGERRGQLDGETRALMPVGSNAQWVDPEVVVFAREGVLRAPRGRSASRSRWQIGSSIS